MNVYECSTIKDRVSADSYVGRGIIVGKTADGKKLEHFYFPSQQFFLFQLFLFLYMSYIFIDKNAGIVTITRTIVSIRNIGTKSFVPASYPDFFA